MVPLSWTDQHLLTRIPRLCSGGGSVKIICHHSLMDPTGFQVALGHFPVDTVNICADAPVDLWNGEVTQASDMIVPRHSLSGPRALTALGLLRGCV